MSRVPVTAWKSSPAMCCEVPGPADPKVIDQTAQTANPQPAKAETKA